MFLLCVSMGCLSDTSQAMCTENQSPNPPEIKGCRNSSVGSICQYNFTISDPDGHRLTELYIEFGDEANQTIVYTSSCSCRKGWRSGTILSVDHIWRDAGNVSIRAKVKDYFGKWSDWGFFDVQVDDKIDIFMYGHGMARLIQEQKYFDMFIRIIDFLR